MVRLRERLVGGLVLDGGSRRRRFCRRRPYWLVLGQPRQEDLLRYLGDNADAMSDLFVDLGPPAGGNGSAVEAVVGEPTARLLDHVVGEQRREARQHDQGLDGEVKPSPS